MLLGLDKIESIINGYDFAKDKERVFTYIEFVKMFGYENNTDNFITIYKEYVTRWANTKNEEIILSDEDFVMGKMIEILKSITLDYSSYEEQDFISHIDLTNKDHIKALIAIYSRKIRQITEFYRKKRNESVLIVNRNSFKGSAKSIQEIIYEKVFDYLFSDRNIVPSYVNIKRDLLISVENYVDIYSEYFDIPRERKFTDKTRAEMLSANMNDVDYRAYLEIELVVSEILFSGNVFLEEIPLIAQLGIDLSQNCVGDMLALKNTLTANTTINQVPLTEQVALKRRLYEKFLGCDLYYMYVDLQGDVKIDVLCRANNPTGNLLNCATADTATIENEQLELLSHIGLFFKPDKTSILKVNAKSFVWSVDTDVIQPDTMYIFPDPTKYGDIGNNKSSQYPLIMEYKLNYDIRNMSSGDSVDDPLMFITDQGWRSYYSKQDDDFKLIDNVNYEYSFTYLANQGFLQRYQTDAWGNQFGILKGCNVTFLTDKNTGEFILDEDGNKIIETVTLPKNYSRNELTHVGSEIKDTGAILLNGGYFEDPYYQGSKIKKSSGEYVWAFQGDENDTRPFDYSKSLKIDDYYNWSGLKIKMDSLYYSDYTNNSVNFGTFGSHNKVLYSDNFQFTGKQYEYIEDDDTVIKEVLLPFMSQNVFDNPDYKVIVDDSKWEDYNKKGGELYIKLCNSLYDKPKKFNEIFPWVDLNGEQIVDIHVIHEVLIIETETKIKFIPYNYNGETISNTLGLRELLELDKSKFLANKIIYLENERVFYILQLDQVILDNKNELRDLHEQDYTIQTMAYRRFLMPRFYKFDPIKYKIQEVVNFADPYYIREYENNKLNQSKLWSTYLSKKEEIIQKDTLQKVKKDLLSNQESEYSNLRDFEIYYFPEILQVIDAYDFTFNSSLGIFLLTISIRDKNNTPYIYEYKFKLNDTKTFNDSLRSNVYTLKNDGVSFKWNEKLSPNNVTTHPNNFKSLGENTIFEYCERSNFGEDDSYFNGNKYNAKFDLVENDHAEYDEKVHIGHTEGHQTTWVEEIDDTFGNNVKCYFSSDCYIGNCEILERQENIKTACDLLFKIDDYVRCGDNVVEVWIRKLEAEGTMNKVYDFIDNGKQPFLGQNGIQDAYWYEVNFDRDIKKKINLQCDAFGNVCGNCSIRFENLNFKAKEETLERKVNGELRLCLYGTANNIKAEAHMNVFDITGIKVENDIERKLYNWSDLGFSDIDGNIILVIQNDYVEVIIEDAYYKDVILKPISDVTVQDDGLFYVELNGEKDDSIFSLKGNMKIESMSLKNISVKFVENDAEIIEPDIPDNIDIVVGSPYIPDASSWNEEVYRNNDLKIVRVLGGIAYDG